MQAMLAAVAEHDDLSEVEAAELLGGLLREENARLLEERAVLRRERWWLRVEIALYRAGVLALLLLLAVRRVWVRVGAFLRRFL